MKPTQMKSNRILYIGRFEMPDKDATANRVMNNARLLRDLGYEVTFFGWSNEAERFRERPVVRREYDGFTCYEKRAYVGTGDRLQSIFDASAELAVMRQMPELGMVIAYNFPSVALRKIRTYCHRHGILCLADVTEWYGNGRGKRIKRAVRALDSFYRMQVLHKHMDGLIVISGYLQRYYCKQQPLLLPPLVDAAQPLWQGRSPDREDGPLTVLYAGVPSGTKERLDRCVQAVLELPTELSVRFDVMGVTQERFERIYAYRPANEALYRERVHFWGKVPHDTVLQHLKQADYSLLIRESNRVTNAGFSTKFVESVTCGTPVITTDHSDIRYYVETYACGKMVRPETLESDLRRILTEPPPETAPSDLFDYRHYKDVTEKFLNQWRN